MWNRLPRAIVRSAHGHELSPILGLFIKSTCDAGQRAVAREIARAGCTHRNGDGHWADRPPKGIAVRGDLHLRGQASRRKTGFGRGFLAGRGLGHGVRGTGNGSRDSGPEIRGRTGHGTWVPGLGTRSWGLGIGDLGWRGYGNRDTGHETRDSGWAHLRGVATFEQGTRRGDRGSNPLAGSRPLAAYPQNRFSLSVGRGKRSRRAGARQEITALSQGRGSRPCAGG